MKRLYERCPNAFSINESSNGHKRKLKIEDITNFTTVFERDSFNIQNKGRGLIYYIPKYDTILTADQAENFVNEHKDENFLVVSNYDGRSEKIFFFITSTPNLLTVHCFHAANRCEHMTLFATFKNEFSRTVWEEPTILSPTCLGVYREQENGYRRYYHDEDNESSLYFAFPDTSSRICEGDIINGTKAGQQFPVYKLLTDFLRIEGRTRIVRLNDYGHYFKFATGACPSKEELPIPQRYGLPLSQMIADDANDRAHVDRNFSRWAYKHGGDWILNQYETFDSVLPIEEKERIKTRINAKLDALSEGKDKYMMITTDILVISDPIKGHRRPSFHFIRGFRCNGITEIVELSRGEMLMKDMIPEKVYCLTDMNTYALASYDLKSSMIGLIKDSRVEIDPVSFNKWAEEKSLHPYLLKMLSSNFFETIDLDMVKTLNRLPFGSLLIEQLISTNHGELAMQLANYITKRAYDFNFFCGQLSDIFPGCNGEETSLYKILNISRQSAKYLFEGSEVPMVPNRDNAGLVVFITKYNALHYYGGNLVLTDEIKNKIEIYLKLQAIKLHKFTLLWGNREFDFLKYPNLAKQVIRMYNKIDGLQGITSWQMSDIKNKYDEIVRAYASFLDYSTLVPETERETWNPEHLMIFLEFSLRGTPENPLDPIEEIKSREKAANAALKIYEAKANEKMHDDNEKKFAFRRRCLLKLRNTQALEKDNPDFKGYVVIPPSQIYGVRTIGSVEKEAYDLDHCLFRCYTNRIVEGQYTTMWLRSKDNVDRSIITIGITSDGRIEQTRGKNDRDATPEEAKAIAAWAKSKSGLVTFKSEGSDVRPGGWPCGVPVPSLPKPSKDWLEQLKTVEER